MAKRQDLATRGFGGEPGIPEVAELASWIALHRGSSADLTSFLLDASLAPQVEARITHPCAGGMFMQNRFLESLSGVKDTQVIEEIGVRIDPFSEDAARVVVQNRNAWCALPAPDVLGITDRYYKDKDEWTEAISGVYRTVLREMRDAGVSGHVLICDSVDNEVVRMLARRNVFFFHLEPDRTSLEILLEFQKKVAVTNDQVAKVIDLAGEYDIRQIIILEPDSSAITLALSHLEPDQVIGGGYCIGNGMEYWKNLVKNSFFETT